VELTDRIGALDAYPPAEVPERAATEQVG